MRIGALLLVGVGLGFVFAAACTANTSSDLVCTSAGGTCVALPDAAAKPSACDEVMSNAVCDQGFVCCVLAGSAQDSGPPVDSAVSQTPDSATKG